MSDVQSDLIHLTAAATCETQVRTPPAKIKSREILSQARRCQMDVINAQAGRRSAFTDNYSTIIHVWYDRALIATIARSRYYVFRH